MGVEESLEKEVWGYIALHHPNPSVTSFITRVSSRFTVDHSWLRSLHFFFFFFWPNGSLRDAHLISTRNMVSHPQYPHFCCRSEHCHGDCPRVTGYNECLLYSPGSFPRTGSPCRQSSECSACPRIPGGWAHHKDFLNPKCVSKEPREGPEV